MRDLLQQFVAAPAGSTSRQRALQQRHDLRHGERAQRVDLRARQQRRDHFERRILRGGADQDDVAALHVGQKRVLLRFVEAVDLVDEQDGAPAQRRRRSASAITALISLMPLSTALKGTNSQRVTRAIRCASVVLPTPGGPHRMIERQLVALDLRAQRFAGPEDVLLADVVFQPVRAACARPAAACCRRGAAAGGVVSNRLTARSILWRRASYSRMPAATAAFSDSTPTVGIETSRRGRRAVPR